MNWNNLFEKILIVYFVISIAIEILEVVFYFTPSKEDDVIIHKVKEYWTKISKYALILSIRTPVTTLLQIVLTILTSVVDFIKRKK